MLDRVKDLFYSQKGLSNEEVERIDQAIMNFTHKRDRLYSCDNKIIAAEVADSVLWGWGLLGTWGKYICVPLYAAIYFGLSKSLDRDYERKKFDEALDELYETYRICTADKPSDLSSHPKFLELLQTLIPYACDLEQLIVWPLNSGKPDELSPQYRELFSQRAQQLSFDAKQPEGNAEAPALLNALTSGLQLAGLKDVPAKLMFLKPQARSVFGFFNTGWEGAKLYAYGHHFKDDVIAAPRKG